MTEGHLVPCPIVQSFECNLKPLAKTLYIIFKKMICFKNRHYIMRYKFNIFEMYSKPFESNDEYIYCTKANERIDNYLLLKLTKVFIIVILIQKF